MRGVCHGIIGEGPSFHTHTHTVQLARLAATPALQCKSGSSIAALKVGTLLTRQDWGQTCKVYG